MTRKTKDQIATELAQAEVEIDAARKRSVESMLSHHLERIAADIKVEFDGDTATFTKHGIAVHIPVSRLLRHGLREAVGMFANVDEPTADRTWTVTVDAREGFWSDFTDAK